MTPRSHPGRAFATVIFAFMVNMAGTTLPTAVYRYYQQQYAYSALTITVIYACYALGVIGALLVAGNWSDQLGRRRMLLAALGASALAALSFLFSHGLSGLLLGRLLSGLSAGIFTGTGTVAVIELAPPAWQRHATLAATAANMLGLGCGPLLGGVLVDVLPWPTRLPYAAHLLLLLLAMLAVRSMPEPVAIVARPRLRMQRLALPAAVRGVFVPAAIAGFAGFVVIGFCAAVMPQLIAQVFGYRDSALIGAAVFLLFACSALGQVGQARLIDRRRLPAGCACLILGLIVIAACVPLASLAMLLAGTAIAGLGQGISFRAGLGAITAQCPPAQRAGVASSFFVVLYVAISLPVIGVGLIVQATGIRLATELFALATAALVVYALLLVLARQRRIAG